MDISKDIEKVREKIKTEGTIEKRPFALGMYSFSMFILDYFTRVRKELNIDYESFMIVQTVVSHNLYNLNKKSNGVVSFEDLENEWTGVTAEIFDQIVKLQERTKNQKLTISSICLVVGLPKETVRRKVSKLTFLYY